MINYGIDLGTTNSAIAKFVKGEVEVFKNPMETGKETLPSVVYYKKDKHKPFIGSGARTYLERDSANVFSCFKRKMGTTESYKVKNLNQSKTPIELSAEVLKELKGFVHTGEQVDAAIITIPASFGIIQSNATKEAGYLAGFKQVILLQEPIAASLAYSNKHKNERLENGLWMVYDLGGGTFDVALIKIQDGEMKVLDHEGNNFLGGTDFDNLIVEDLIIPFLNSNYTFNNFENELKSASGKYNSLYYKLLHLSEIAKITLSSKTSTEIDFSDFHDDNDIEVNISFEIARSEFENLIKSKIGETIDMIKKILHRNSLRSSDIQFILMVGGSTYIPYVRTRVEEILQIRANCDIDPITAIAIGAAYYAGTKEKNFESETHTISEDKIKIKFAYQKASQDNEELLACKVDGNTEGLYYQILREDKGYDSGKKKLMNRFSEDLPLLPNTYNYFKFKILDEQNNVIETGCEVIGIAQGKYSVVGQPLSSDICLQTDISPNIDKMIGNTKLSMYFQKNTILPVKQTKTATLNKTILEGSTEKVYINVLEGSQFNLPEANQTIGYLEISGTMLNGDIYRGDDIDITIEMTESQDLKVTVYISRLNQEFTEVFNPSKRHSSIAKLKEEIITLKEKLDIEISEALKIEDYESANALKSLIRQMDELSTNTKSLSDDDVTASRYQFEDKKRQIAQEIDNATRDKKINSLKNEYFDDKDWCERIINENGNDQDQMLFKEIIGREKSFLSSNIPIKIIDAIDDLISLGSNILWRTPEFLESKFHKLSEKPQVFNNQVQAESLIKEGKTTIINKNFQRLKEINMELIGLLPNNAQKEWTGKIGFELN